MQLSLTTKQLNKAQNMNNFDTSSKGVNLELAVNWDQDLAQTYFDESFRVLQYSSHSQSSILVFSMWGNIDVSNFDLYDPENFNINVSGKELMRLFYDHVGGDYKDLLQEYCNWFSMADFTTDSVIAFIYDYYQCEVERSEFLDKHFNCTYKKLESRGYSQGDYSEIILPKNVLEYIKKEVPSCNNMTFKQIAEYYQDDIDHLCWDTPLYARLTIDNDSMNDFYLDDFQKDRYSYDKQEVINHVKNKLKHEKLGYILGWLGDNLPDQPEYSY